MRFVNRRNVLSVLILGVVAVLGGTTLRSYVLRPRMENGIYVTQSSEQRIRRAYDIARSRQDLLSELPCHCGCMKKEHNPMANVLECFKSEHAETCSVCLNTALYAEKAVAEGKSVAEMQRFLSNVYEFDFETGSKK